MLRFVLFVALTACGARTELETPAPRSLCVSRDPPVLLRTWNEPGWVHGLTTDGREVFLSESSAPSVWAMDVKGGAPTSFDTGASPNYSIGTPLFAWNGGLYFDTWRDDPFPLRWVADDGSGSKSVATANMLAFDPSGTRAFQSGGVAFLVVAVSLIDGTRTPIIPADGAALMNVLTSVRFLHAIVITDSVVDRRMNLSSGAIDNVTLGNFAGIVSSSNGVCFTDTNSVACLSDDDDAPKTIAAKVEGISSADASWVYMNASHRFSRLSRIDGHEETLLDVKAMASVPFRSCVFAVTANGSAMSLWRLAP